jgi:hypothetical protein
VEAGLFKVNALFPGVSYELGIAQNATLNFEAIVGFALNGGSNRRTEYGIFPGVMAEYRKYLNMDRRLGKDKNISGNSGNYLGLVNQFQHGNPLFGNLEFASDHYYNLALVYGIQRTRPKGFYWGISFGPAIFLNDFGTDPGILVDARLGWVIGHKKK